MVYLVCFHKLFKIEGDDGCAFTYSIPFLSANMSREPFNEKIFRHEPKTLKTVLLITHFLTCATQTWVLNTISMNNGIRFFVARSWAYF